MPIYIKENSGTVNHYEKCTVYNGVAQVQQPGEPVEVVDVVSAEEEAQIHHSIIQADAEEQQVLELLFRADDDDHERTEILLSALIKGKKVKTKIVKALRENRRYFNLQNLTLEDKTRVINAWVEKLGYSEQLNGKKFTIKDW